METVLTIGLIIAAVVTGVLLLVRTNRDATKQEKRITLIIAAVFLAGIRSSSGYPPMIVDIRCSVHREPRSGASAPVDATAA